MNSGPFYRNLGDDIGVSVHSVPPNPRFEIEPTHNIGYDIEYDNGYIQRISQNNYDQRWYRKSNIVRLGEFNNAPYINTEFYTTFIGLVGKLVDYAPLGSSSYDPEETFSLPRSEQLFLTTAFGQHRVDFAGLNIITNKEVNVSSRTINPTVNSYVNPEVTLSDIGEHTRLHMYLVNSTGPYSYSLNAKRLNHVEQLIKHPYYRINFSIQNTEQVDAGGVTRFDVGPVNSKARLNNVLIETPDGTLAKTNYEIFYPSLTEYFDEDKEDFRKLPRKLIKPILESRANTKYKTIFGAEGKRLNGHIIKYFDFAEQIYPRRQLNVQWLDNYETATEFLLEESHRKVAQAESSHGTSLAAINGRTGNAHTTGFSSWPTETFEAFLHTPPGFGSALVKINSGELMQLNCADSYFKLRAVEDSSPFGEVADPADTAFANDSLGGYRIQSYGYRINHRNRPDSTVPSDAASRPQRLGADFIRVAASANAAVAPYKRYEAIVSAVSSDHPTMAIVAEYRAETSIDDFLQGGCSQLSSAPEIFGLSWGNQTKKVLGLASYSDEMFQLKDIHEQIDKF